MLTSLRERRKLKIAFVSERDLLGLFLMKQQPGPTKENEVSVRVAIVLDGVPEDTTFEAVNYDYQRQAFFVVIGHESFEPVKEYERFPETTVSVRQVWVNHKNEIIGTCLREGQDNKATNSNWRDQPPLF